MQHYCVIGFPVEHSLSPQIHNAAFHALRIQADFAKVTLPPEQLADFMLEYRGKYAGGNVTIPHKETVMKFLDEIDPEARAIGAVNTIVNRKGRLFGYNTDGPGAMRALQEGLKIEEGSPKWLRGKNVCVIGAGGAARAIIHGVLKNGGTLTILNRTIERAAQLAQEFIHMLPAHADPKRYIDIIMPIGGESLEQPSIAYGGLEDFKADSFDILINTTSSGMYPNIQEIPIKISEPLPKNFTVMDVIYYPRQTLLIRTAREFGARTVTGERMFLYQGALAFELWTGQKSPLKIMEEVLLKSLDEREKTIRVKK